MTTQAHWKTIRRNNSLMKPIASLKNSPPNVSTISKKKTPAASSCRRRFAIKELLLKVVERFDSVEASCFTKLVFDAKKLVVLRYAVCT